MDKSIIRIKSAYKWREPIVINTSLPTIVPPIISQPREAFAQLKSPLAKASEYSVRAKRKVRCTNPTARISAYRAIPEELSRWLVMLLAALISSVEPSIGFRWPTIRFRMSDPRVFSSSSRFIPHD
jgi:hypothetical protein